MGVKWEKYNPDWLIKETKKLFPEEVEIIKNLERCTSSFKESKAYYYFVYSENPNEPDSDWQFDENIKLNDTVHGDVVLDILKGKKVGGIEFLKYL